MGAGGDDGDDKDYGDENEFGNVNLAVSLLMLAQLQLRFL